MPGFSFNVTIKKKDNKKQIKTKNNIQIIEKNISGVVSIDINGVYSVNGLEIAPENYTCEGFTRLYYQGLQDKQRVLYIRDDIDKKIACDTKNYLPFTVGCCVVGNIIQNVFTNKSWFYIKKVFINYDNIESQKALEFYRQNYEQILINKRMRND